MNAEERNKLMELENRTRTKPSEEELKSKFGKHWWKPSKDHEPLGLILTNSY